MTAFARCIFITLRKPKTSSIYCVGSFHYRSWWWTVKHSVHIARQPLVRDRKLIWKQAHSSDTCSSFILQHCVTVRQKAHLGTDTLIWHLEQFLRTALRWCGHDEQWDGIMMKMSTFYKVPVLHIVVVVVVWVVRGQRSRELILTVLKDVEATESHYPCALFHNALCSSNGSPLKKRLHLTI